MLKRSAWVWVFIFVGLFGCETNAKTVIERLEATVNSSHILFSDIFDFRKTFALRNQLDPLFAGTELAKEGPHVSNQKVISFLTEEKLVLQNFPVKDAEVEQEINAIQAANHFDRNALKQALKEQGFTFEEYFELIRASVSKRNLIDRDIRTKVHISEDDVKNHFYHRSNEGQKAFSYQMGIITLSRESYSSTKGLRDQLEQVQVALKGGESFSEVAKKYSDSATASSGGEVGFLSEQEMSPEIKKVIKTLKVGEISSPILTADGGYYLLKLMDIRSGQEKALEEQKASIRNQLAAAEYQRQIEFWITREKQNAYIHRAGEPSLPPQ